MFYVKTSFGDADNIPPDTNFPKLVKSALGENEYFIYSTHSHAPDQQRYRLVFPFSREISEDEYPAVMRQIAKQIGIVPSSRTKSLEIRRGT